MAVSLRGVSGGAGKPTPDTIRGPVYDAAYLDLLEATKPSTVKRAMKREVMKFGDGWLVMGNPGLGDSKSQYQVQMVGGKWDCQCYHSDHGDARARKGCSHVLGVALAMRAGSGIEATGTADIEVLKDATLPEEEVGQLETKVKKGGKKKASKKGSKKARKAGKKARKLKAARPLREDIWLPSTPALIPPGFVETPEWLEEYRPHQWDAAMEVEEAIRDGKKVVYLDAPTGTGKTGIADLVSRLEQRRLVYLCSSKQLQEQVLGDFPYARVLKGRANYATARYPRNFPDITCDDCDGEYEADNCSMCPEMRGCPYRVAKRQAMGAQLAVLNTAYWLREANYVGGFARKAEPGNGDERLKKGGLFVFDECDELENALLGMVDFRLTRGMMRTLGLVSEPPKKGSHRQTIAAWIVEELLPVVERQFKGQPRTIEGLRAARRLSAFYDEAGAIAEEYAEDAEERWIRDNDDAPLSLKPVMVSRHGRDLIWPHVGTAVLMSATIISADELSDSLGVEHDTTATISVPMTFPVENMPIYVAPVASMRGGIAKAQENGEAEKIALGVRRICEMHPNERVLVHCVSYKLTTYLIAHTRRFLDRPWFTYSRADEREQALAAYRSTPRSVLFAPSFDRGVDLKGDDCRVIVIAKMPKPYVGDARVKARSNGPGGNEWYAVQTVRTLVQMTGRGMRAADDHCTSYILDADFMEYQRQYSSLLPKWWRRALINRHGLMRQLTN